MPPLLSSLRSVLLAVFFAAAFVARLASPSGFMPANIDGHAVLVACDGHGPAASAKALGAPAHHGKSGEHQGNCDFSAAGSSGLVSPTTALPPLALLVEAGPPKWRALAFDVRAAARERPPAQAPPLA